MATKTLLTEEQFAALPDDERVRHELVEGELVSVPSPTPRHCRVRDNTAFRLRSYLAEQPIGVVISEVDCRTTSGTVRRPDVSFFSTEQYASVDESRLPIPFVPVLALEVPSPSESALEVARKRQEYLAGGCREVWLVDTANREVQVWTGSGVRRLLPNDTLESPLLPGFRLLVKDLLDAR